MFGFKKIAMPTAAEALSGRTYPIRTATTHFIDNLALKGPYPEGSQKAMFGLGCFWGLELVKDRATREPLVPFNGASEDAKPMGAVMKRALDRGLYLMTHWNVVMCCPPLTITRDELDEALAILDDALSVADEFVT